MIFQNYIICEYSIKNNDEIFLFNSFEEVKKINSAVFRCRKKMKKN